MSSVGTVQAGAALAALACVLGCSRGDDRARPSAPREGELPGAEPLSDAVREKIAAATASLPGDYRPRTRHLRPDGVARYTNRLILESSPYLRQHAHNPVNWYAWGEEAFEAARRLGRPILLSIGYSTCHWCHVMEEESFEDEEIARTLNEHYVAIKVDREERPDIDSIYMTALQAMGIDGGWPLNVWLTPDLRPYFGGTYFPPRDGDRGARRGLLTILVQAAAVYRDKPDAIAASGEHVVKALADAAGTPGGDSLPDAAVLAKAAELYAQRFDPAFGGLKTGPGGGTKFPSSLPVRFLLRQYRRTGDRALLEMVTLTLHKMAAGGLRDHVGGGFHRYSTDRRWLVPHFEKMLYDNALLAIAYLETYQVTGDGELAEIAREILGWAVGDMMSPDGAFYSATDADSPNPKGVREEGWFFTWTPQEIDGVLSGQPAELVKRYFDITERGNFEGSRSIPNTPRTLDEVAGPLGIAPGDARKMVAESKAALAAARSRRPPPLRDDKILTAWNGLMISALARAARIVGRDDARGIDYAAHARRTAEFVLGKLRDGGRLRRSYHGGRAYLNGYLDDHAFVIAGLLDLFEATGERRWLDDAIALDRVLARHYEDAVGGAFYLTSDDHEQLLAREKPTVDSALPSANSWAVMNLLRLHELTTKPDYLARADRALTAFSDGLARTPTSYPELLLAVDFRLDAVKQIVIVAPSSRDEAAPFLARLARTFVPNHVLVVTPQGSAQAELAARIPLVEGKTAIRGKPTAYVCEKQSCKLPTSDPAVFARQIGAR